MSASELPLPLRGIVPPMATPLLDRDRLDVEGLERLIDHIVDGGVHGLFVLGTTGEAPSLGYRLRGEVIERACKHVNARVPVLVGITDTAFVESVNIAKKASDAGAQAVVLAPPYYFPAGQAELLEYLEHLVPELPLPVFLYNMPSLTKSVYEPETVRKAADLSGVVGVKDSSCDMRYFHLLRSKLKDRPDFTLLTGPEELLAETLLLGGHGGVNGGANLFPRLYVELHEAAQAQDLARVRELHAQVMEVATLLYGVGQYTSSMIKGLKCALNCVGICSDFLAEPFHRFREAERDRIKKNLATLKLSGRHMPSGANL